MKKYIGIVAGFATLFVASTASAQAYYSTPAISAGVCTTLSGDLSQGSRGNEVTRLQQFLVSQNYPGGGSWMVTGYFGSATKAALMLFQQSAGLPQSGYLDASARAAIQSRSCQDTNLYGVFSYPYSSSAYSYAPQYSTNYPYYGGISISSLSSYSAQVGSSVTVYGTGFDAYGNTVRIGGTTVTASASGNVLTFTVPFMQTGTYGLTVSNSRGTSNALSLSIVGNTYNYNQYCNTSAYQWWLPNCNLYTYSSISLSHLTPNWTGVGTQVTVTGTGFSSYGNTVYFGTHPIPNISSANGTSLSFTVPSFITTVYGSQNVTPGDYPVRVANGNGAQSNTLTLSVTQQGSTNPVISSVSGPNALTIGALGTWTLVVNAPYGSYVTASVNWGDGYPLASAPQSVYGGSQSMTFTHSYASAGNYTVTFTVTTPSGSNTSTATVAVSNTSPGSNTLSLTSVSPLQGRIGTSVTLMGAGFTSSDNIIHFGVGGSRNVSSYNNGTTMTFVVPSYVSPCDLIQSGYVCGAPVSSVVPGVYPIYVTNPNGATSVYNFTVLP